MRRNGMIRTRRRCTGRRRFIWMLLIGQVLGALFFSTRSRAAEASGPPSPPSQRDPVAEQLFAPELVMSHQTEIGLTAAQRQTLISELQRLQTEVVPLQFEVQAASEALVELLAGERVEEERALAQAKRLMELEQQVRATHLALLVRIKNLLSVEQQTKLAAIRGGGAR